MPCHNRCEALRLTLEALCRQSVPGSDYEVLVVDQASTDGSRALVRSYAAPYTLRLIEQDGKYGISVARNAGVQAAESEFILLLDADLLADENLVDAHLARHAAAPEALLCGRVLPYLPAYTGFVDHIANPEAGLDRGTGNEPFAFYQAFGGHLAFSKAVFAHVGPFDPLLKGFEDIEFAYRASQLGYAILNNARAVSYHNHPRSPKERFEQARSYNRMLPIVFERYPELKGQIPGLSDFEPVNWRMDRGKRLINKLRVRVFSLPAVQSGAQAVLFSLDRSCRAPRLVRFLFWQLLIGNGYLGFREGAARNSAA